MSAFRGNSASGRADPAKLADLERRLHRLAEAQHADRIAAESSDVPIDMMDDPAAARAAIRAKYGAEFVDG